MKLVASLSVPTKQFHVYVDGMVERVIALGVADVDSFLGRKDEDDGMERIRTHHIVDFAHS